MTVTAMQAADATIVNVALPRLQADLGDGPSLGAWVLISYLCATAVMAPLTGWLRRRYGGDHLFPVAVGGFMLASFLCALAPTAGAIILFRILQGAAGGIIHPLSQAALLDIFPKDRHGKMLSIWAAGTMVGPILGPPLGGIITDLSSWRWVFAVNLPIGLIAIWLIRRVRYPTRREQVSVDIVSVVLLTLGIAALQLGLQRSIGRALLEPEILAEISLTLMAFVSLGFRARSVGFSLLRPAVFRDLNFAVASFYNFTLSALLFVAVVFLPLLAEGPLAYPAAVAGSLIVPRAVLMTLVILGVGQLIGKIRYRILLTAGWLLMAAGLAVLSALRPESAVMSIIIGSTIQAIGAGMLYTPHSTLAFSTLSAELRTEAAGAFSLLRQLGYATGVVVMTEILQLRTTSHLANLAGWGAATSGPLAVADLAVFEGYTDCFRIMAGVCLAIIPGIFLFRLPPRPSLK